MLRSLVSSTRAQVIAVGMIAVLTILALVLAVVAQSKAAAAQAQAARVAKVQADQAAHQTELLRDAICGTFVDVAAAPVTPKITELGRRLIRDTDHGAQVAGCPR